MQIALTMRLILAIAWSWCPHRALEPSGLPQHAPRSASRSEVRATRRARSAFRFCFEEATGMLKGFGLDSIDSAHTCFQLQKNKRRILCHLKRPFVKKALPFAIQLLRVLTPSLPGGSKDSPRPYLKTRTYIQHFNSNFTLFVSLLVKRQRAHCWSI